MSFFPIIELVDRLAIAKVKWRKTQLNAEELEWYQQQAKQIDLEKIIIYVEELEIIHDAIWELEAELKSNQEQNLSLEEIGRRAIEIRNLNNKRIALKNQAAELLGCNVREIKKNHLSQ